MTTLISSQELANRWKVSIQTIYNRITSGQNLPPSIKIGANRRRWNLKDVEIWENDNKEDTRVGTQ